MKKLLLFGALAFGLNAFGQVPSYVPTSGLVGWWGFNGNANDESGNGYNGTVVGATLTTDRFGTPNSAYAFDGNDYIEHTQPSSVDFSNGMSVACWAEITDTNDYDNHQFFVSKAVDTLNGHYALLWNDANKKVTGDLNKLMEGTAFGTDTYTIPFSNVVHLVLSYDNDSLRFYVNGLLDTVVAYGVGLPNITDIVHFGKHKATLPPQAEYFMVGTLDDIGIWNRALTSCEVTELYTGQACNVGLEELTQANKELVQIIDFMGRETEYKPNTPLIFIYSDGTRERVMKIEE